MSANPLLVEVCRGSVVESVHRGAVAVVDADGALVMALGDVDRPVLPRSAIKLLQALPLVESGAADALGLTDEELALACASHNAEPAHVKTAASMLAKAGLDATALECGVHWPKSDAAERELARAGEAPGALHNNCSGKHAGFACLACRMAAQAPDTPALRGFLSGYVQSGHPVMREVTAAIAAATGYDLASVQPGIDGCSIPTYPIPLRHLAHAYARVATGVGLRDGHARAARRLRSAIARAPFMVSGTDGFDTLVMQRLGERVCCKVGAEGVYCAALPEQGLGVAIKIDDGTSSRAAEVVMAAVIEARVLLADDERAFMRTFSERRLRNWNGIDVGLLRAAESLSQALAPRR